MYNLHMKLTKGKGRGLKTAFEFCLENRKTNDGVVTVDGDNQHHVPKDDKKCSDYDLDNIVLGVKDFPGDDRTGKNEFE